MIVTAITKNWSRYVLATIAIFIVLVPFEWCLGRYTELAINIGLSTMVTVGLCMLMGYTGQVSLGQMAFFGVGAYVSAILSTDHGIDPWVGMMIAATATGVIAFVLGPIFRLRGDYLALATLAVGFIVWKLAVVLVEYTGGQDGMTGIPYFSIGGFEFDSDFRRYFLVWGFCAAILLISQNIVKSRTGRALRAIHSNEAAAESIGINVNAFKIKIFVLSAVYASLAGSLFAHHRIHVSPEYFHPLESVEIVVMAVIGGLASIGGAIFGAGTIHILNDELLVDFGTWQDAIAGLILIVILIFMPLGLFVSLRMAYDRDGIWFLPKWIRYIFIEWRDRILSMRSKGTPEYEHREAEL